MDVERNSIKMKKICFFCVYAVFTIWLFRFFEINSDLANHLLQADDILTGNFFLSDWNLTGITFLTTDLIYYEIGRIFCGVSYRAIYVANGLKIFSIFVVAYGSVMKDCVEDRKLKEIIFILAAGIPCMNYMVQLQVHTGAVFLSFCILNLAYATIKSSDAADKKMTYYSAGLFMLAMLGTIGDMLVVVEGVIPVLIFSMYQLLMVKDSDNHEIMKYIKLIAALLAGVLAAVLWDKFYFWIGGANKNSYVTNKLFTDSSQWMSKLNSFIAYILDMNMANFTGVKIADFWNLLKFANVVFIFVGLIFMCRILWLMMKKKYEQVDALSSMLTFSIMMLFAAFLFTDMSEARYISMIPLAVIVIVVRNCSWVMDAVENRKFCISIVLTVVLISFTGKVHEMSGYQYPQSNRDDYELISFLDSHDLHYGYASFWNASKITVFSGKRVNVRHVVQSGDKFEMFNWFNKNEWYHENTRFVLINNSDGTRGETDAFGVSEEETAALFGVPAQSYTVNNYLILVYDYNLSTKI